MIIWRMLPHSERQPIHTIAASALSRLDYYEFCRGGVHWDSASFDYGTQFAMALTLTSPTGKVYRTALRTRSGRPNASTIADLQRTLARKHWRRLKRWNR